MKKNTAFHKGSVFLLIGFLLTSDRLDVAFAHPPVNEADAVWTGHQQVHPVGIFAFCISFLVSLAIFPKLILCFPKFKKP